MNYTLKIYSIFKIIAIILCLGCNLATAQTPEYYSVIDDAAGFQTDNSVEEMKDYAGMILQDHVAQLGDLRIYSYAFYVHDESKSDWDIASSMNRAKDLVKQVANSDHYLIIGKSSGPNAICKDFHVSLNMPDIHNGCIDRGYYVQLAKEIENTIRSNYSGNYEDYVIAEKAGLNVFGGFLDEADECCPTGVCNFDCDVNGINLLDIFDYHYENSTVDIPLPNIENVGQEFGTVTDFYGLEDPLGLVINHLKFCGTLKTHVVISDVGNPCALKLIDDLKESTGLLYYIEIVDDQTYVEWYRVNGTENKLRDEVLFGNGSDPKVIVSHVMENIRAISEDPVYTLSEGSNTHKSLEHGPLYFGPRAGWVDGITKDFVAWFNREKNQSLGSDFWRIMDEFWKSKPSIFPPSSWDQRDNRTNYLWDFPGFLCGAIEIGAKEVEGVFETIVGFKDFLMQVWEEEYRDNIRKSISEFDLYEFVTESISGAFADELACYDRHCVGVNALEHGHDKNSQLEFAFTNARDALLTEPGQYCTGQIIIKVVVLFKDISSGAGGLAKLVNGFAKNIKSKGIIKTRTYDGSAVFRKQTRIISNNGDYKLYASQKAKALELDDLAWDKVNDKPVLNEAFTYNDGFQSKFGEVTAKLPESGNAFWDEFDEVFPSRKGIEDDFDFAPGKKGDKFFDDLHKSCPIGGNFGRSANKSEDCFHEFLKNNPKGINAWDAILKLSDYRRLTDKLEAVNDFVSNKGIDHALVKLEVNSLPDFERDLIRGFEISNGTKPYPLLANTGDISTNGALHGSFQNGQFVPVGNAQPNGFMDFVALPDGQILLGTKHTYLSQGADVLAAGTVKLANGVVKDITNLSGHYVPTPGDGMNFLRVFKDQGVDIDNSFLSMYNADGTIFKQVAPSANVRKLYE